MPASPPDRRSCSPAPGGEVLTGRALSLVALQLEPAERAFLVLRFAPRRTGAHLERETKPDIGQRIDEIIVLVMRELQQLIACRNPPRRILGEAQLVHAHAAL